MWAVYIWISNSVILSGKFLILIGFTDAPLMKNSSFWPGQLAKNSVLRIVSARKGNWWWSGVSLVQYCLFAKNVKYPGSLNSGGMKQETGFFAHGSKALSISAQSKIFLSSFLGHAHRACVYGASLLSQLVWPFCFCFTETKTFTKQHPAIPLPSHVPLFWAVTCAYN